MSTREGILEKVSGPIDEQPSVQWLWSGLGVVAPVERDQVNHFLESKFPTEKDNPAAMGKSAFSE
jgi:hypothetical protein